MGAQNGQQRRRGRLTHKKQAMKKRGKNPAVSAKQYGMAQAVLSGRSKAMPKSVAQELIDKTPERTRSKFAKELAATRKRRGNRKNAGKSRFEKCVKSVEKRGGAASPRAVCASAGRKKYGAAAFAKMAAAGRRKHGHNPHVATMTEGRVRADIHELKGYGKKEYEALITGGRETLGEVFDSLRGAMSWARIKLHEVATANPLRRRNQLETLLIGDAALGGKDSIVSKLGKLAGKKKFSLKHNPEAASEELYQVFHGFPSEEVLEYVQEEHEHGWLWGVGTLVSLEVMNVKGTRTVELKAPDPGNGRFDDVVQLAANELSLLARLAEGEDLSPEIRDLIKGYEEYAKFGDQLFFVGGDQRLEFDFLVEKFGMDRDDIRERMLIGTVTKLTYRTKKSFEKEGTEEIDFWHKLGGEHSKGVCPVLIYKPLTESMELAGGRYFVAPGDKSLKGISPGIVG